MCVNTCYAPTVNHRLPAVTSGPPVSPRNPLIPDMIATSRAPGTGSVNHIARTRPQRTKGKPRHMERVLVTGGAGFIGSHLVESLLDSGTEVLVIDNFQLGKREHLGQGHSAGRVTVVEADIRNTGDLRPVADFAPDVIFHMAALHFIPYCNAHPAEALDVNVLGTDAVLRAARAAPLKTFVFPSSGAIYGFGDEPWRETAPARPDEIYGISKWMGERIMARLHADRPDVRTVVARLFNTYGPRETNPHVLPDIMKRMHEGKTVELGNLWPKRDLIFVTDTA